MAANIERAATPGRGRRRGRPRVRGLAARRRGEIIAAAVAEFARHGFAHTDVANIARRAGCAKGTVFNYFPSKRRLFEASVDQVMRGLSEAVDAAQTTDPLQQLAHLVRAFLEYFDSHPQFIELLMQERSEFRDRADSSYVRFREQRRRLWRSRLASMMRAGLLRRMPADRMLDVISNLLYGTIFTTYFRHRRGSVRQQAEEVLSVLLNGLLSANA